MARKPKAQSNEDRLIARHFKPIARHPGALGLIDDAAMLSPPPGHDLVVTTDAIVGGVHFFPDDPADAIARKALRVNLSDLAAKGASPAGFLLTLALPKGISEAWLEAFSRALGADAKRYGCPLLGGDTVRTPGPLTVSITAFGVLPAGTMVRRDGARVGDHVLVSGTIGDAALGLQLRRGRKAARRWKLSARERAHLAQRYLLPEPRNALALSGAQVRHRRDGCVGRPCRRSRQAVPRVGRGGGRRCLTRAAVCGRKKGVAGEQQVARDSAFWRRRLRDRLHRAAQSGLRRSKPPRVRSACR